jgi:hypothetical protein
MFTVGNGVLRRLIEGAPLGTGPDNVKGSVWAFVTNDTAAAIEANDFFNAAAGAHLRKGDIILAALDQDGTPESRMYSVTANAAGDVTIAPAKATAIG